MGRPGAGVLLILLLPLAAAQVSMEDGQGDVTRNLSDAADAPWIDILAVRMDPTPDGVAFEMTLAANVSMRNGPANYLFVFTLDGDPDAPVIDQQDGTLLCTVRDTVRCADTGGTYTVVAAGVDGDQVSTAIRTEVGPGQWVLGGAAAALDEDGNVTAQDFTDNALPYATSALDEEPGPSAPDATPWWQTWRLLVLALIVGVGGGWLWNNRKR